VHELSVCQSLIRQAEVVAREHHAGAIAVIRLRVGPLSGVELPLLARAFTVARGGTLAENADLVTESLPVRVRCRTCRAETVAAPNRLLCGACGEWRTELMSGDEMLMTGLELEMEDAHV
jgi:hydrogenase nickel incorporation protein HypA/HybF